MSYLTQKVRELIKQRKAASLPPMPLRRALRVAAGLSQADVAGIVGTTRPTVTRWESGTRTPRGELRRRYADVLEELRRV